ncbi:rhamnogalacturonate lyase-like [Belonocnema kinseyi]|uniref:rhamnogalacturonate lyase-like n=1 Tax=Belonocnema kinseyi TaxID=2817044 RepID=UPI00143D8D76|nr:rhamnogalacturonate lyase-like [Belonocnema kinseyi]XP_033223158.1 rhamnogalacturonate lyase-like [Belonocnema kinseyi]
MYVQDDLAFIKIESHIIMQQELSGIYIYVKAINTGRNPISYGLIRIVYRFNPKVTHKATNRVQEGILPLDSELSISPVIQDTTWRLKDGTIYSKYDYAGYIRNTHYQGVFGNGYGEWLLSASREYHSGSPLKQDLLVHHDALILNCMTAGHFGTPHLTTPPGWSKLYSPWLLYFNEGSEEELKEDAVRQSKVEQSRWPYKWMDDMDYPLKHGSLAGQITGPPRSMVVLSSSLTELFDLQALGYSYSTETDENGDFQLERIRPRT